MFCSSRSSPGTSPADPEKLVNKTLFNLPRLLSSQPDIDDTEGELA